MKTWVPRKRENTGDTFSWTPQSFFDPPHIVLVRKGRFGFWTEGVQILNTLNHWRPSSADKPWISHPVTFFGACAKTTNASSKGRNLNSSGAQGKRATTKWLTIVARTSPASAYHRHDLLKTSELQRGSDTLPCRECINESSC